MIYGYCRISTKKQSIDRQIRNIKAAFPEAVIIEESYTGTSVNRPEWNKLHRQLRENDIIIFDSVSRMSRNASEGFLLYKELFERNVSLVFLKERHIDTERILRTIPHSLGFQSVTETAMLFRIFLIALSPAE